MSESPLTGGCLCGQLRYRADGPLGNVCHCHCESCRRASGAAFVTWGTVPAAGFTVTHGQMQILRSSPQVERGFCADCGTTLSYAFAGRGDELDITLASLDDTGVVAPESHIFVAEKVPWLAIADGLPQYPGPPRSA